jgi:hypothetical protein
LDFSSLNRIIPVKSSALWKGVGVGAGICVFLFLVAIAIPSPLRSRMSTNRMEHASFYSPGFGGGDDTYTTPRRSSGDTGLAMLATASLESDTVHADGPKIVYKGQLNMQVANCAETQKKITELAAAESGFVESSTLGENSARISLRVPSARFDAVRSKVRDLAVRVRQDSKSAADVSKQYVDREARLRNLRAEEQQFLEIMKKAHSVADVLAVTKELSEVRGEIETADVEFRHLKDEIDMAQIEVMLYSQTTAGVEWAPGSSFRSAWYSLLQSLTELADFLIWLVINLPLLLLWVLVIFLLVAAAWYVLRKAFRAMRAIFGKKTPAVQAPPPA